MERPDETIADIIAWLRRPREGENAYLTLWRDEIADRLEAALKREIGNAALKREIGNAAKLREAVGYLCDRMADMDATFDPSEVECLRAALAISPRNCDVGTDNEQIRRWKEFCDKHEVDRSPESFARWAQGPYFEEGGDK